MPFRGVYSEVGIAYALIEPKLVDVANLLNTLPPGAPSTLSAIQPDLRAIEAIEIKTHVVDRDFNLDNLGLNPFDETYLQDVLRSLSHEVQLIGIPHHLHSL